MNPAQARGPRVQTLLVGIEREREEDDQYMIGEA